MRNLPRDYFSGPKAHCAFEARELILRLAPSTEFTKGESSKFNSIASKLWEAATGEQQSMKNFCDDNVDLFRRIQRAVEEHNLAPGAAIAKKPAIQADKYVSSAFWKIPGLEFECAVVGRERTQLADGSSFYV